MFIENDKGHTHAILRTVAALEEWVQRTPWTAHPSQITIAIEKGDTIEMVRALLRIVSLKAGIKDISKTTHHPLLGLYNIGFRIATMPPLGNAITLGSEDVDELEAKLFEREKASEEEKASEQEAKTKNKKYELTREISVSGPKPVHRIRALRDFGDVKAGDLGGWVEGEHNLSHSGNCWVYNNARVYDGARVVDDAKVYDEAEVCDYALVYNKAVIDGRAKVYGSATVYDKAKVCGRARVYDQAKVYGHAKIYSNAQIHGFSSVCGCAEVNGRADIFDWVDIYGAATVHGNAKVYQHATVYDEAQVYGHAQVYGAAQICGKARVCDKDEVCGKVRVYDQTPIDAKQEKGVSAEQKEKAPTTLKPTTREAILDAAKVCVCGKRTTDYGKPENNFATIANLWTTYLRGSHPETPDITATDAAVMLALLKIARISSGTGTEDCFVDLAGYAACGGEIAAQKEETK